MSDCYIGRKPCGCVVAACAIESSPTLAAEWRKHVAKFCADEIKAGNTVEKVPSEYAREHLRMCEHSKRAKVATQEMLAL